MSMSVRNPAAEVRLHLQALTDLYDDVDLAEGMVLVTPGERARLARLLERADGLPGQL